MIITLVKQNNLILIYLGLFLCLSGCVSTPKNKGYGIDLVNYDGSYRDLKHKSESYIKKIYNDSTAVDRVSFYEGDTDSSMFSLSFGDNFFFFIRSKKHLLPIGENIIVKDLDKRKRLMNYIENEFSCKCSRSSKKITKVQLIWQLENGTLASPYNF